MPKPRPSSPIQLGDLVRDTVTAFEGVAISRTEYLHSCVRFGVQPRALHEGKLLDAWFFDEAQLVVVERAVVTPHVPADPHDRGGLPSRSVVR